MIETIYNLESSENKKPEVNIRLPKNIRQIGQSDVTMNCQIYIEENVLAFIKQKPEDEDRIRYGVLLGEKKQGNGYTYVFVNGMIEAEGIIDRTIIFSDDVWTDIYDNLRRYYKDGVIVGWFASMDYDISRDMHSIRKIHLDHFAGNSRLFLNVNWEENEEAFYVYERNGLRKQSCYHVYFEKSYEFEDYLFGAGKTEKYAEQKNIPTKETGKYGIAINNIKNNSEGVKHERQQEKADIKEEPRPLPISKYKRIASFTTILALAGILGFMGKEGQLNALQDKMEGIVGNIIDKKEDVTGDIISVNGNVDKNEGESQSAEELSEEVTNNQAKNETEEDGTGKTEEAGSGEAVADKSSDEEAVADGDSAKEGVTDESATKEGVTDESATKEGVTDEGSTKEGVTDEGSTKKTATEGSATETATTEAESQTDKVATLSEANSNYETHIVKAGETLYSIVVAKYGDADKIQEVVQLNNLEDENHVIEGQKIFLP